jgi:hypothetical protein
MLKIKTGFYVERVNLVDIVIEKNSDNKYTVKVSTLKGYSEVHIDRSDYDNLVTRLDRLT